MKQKQTIGFDKDEEKDLFKEMTDLTTPFDPTKIDIQAKQTTMDAFIKRLQYEEIDLKPEFQRSIGLWSKKTQSRLIESLLIRFPLPAFYFDASDDNSWKVVDGVQRLSTIKAFVIDKTLELDELEFLKEYNKSSYDDLPRILQRRIDEAQVTAYLIKRDTPPNVKYSLFHRINTGNTPLKPQEIRHALSQGVHSGQASEYLKQITQESLFKKVVRVSNKRMSDRELVLRYIALKLEPYTNYRAPMITFLNNAMETLGKAPKVQLERLKKELLEALELAKDIFGEDTFIKLSKQTNKKHKSINRALFEVITVLFSNLSHAQKDHLKQQKVSFLKDYIALFEKNDFHGSITYSTGHKTSVTKRFETINSIIQKHTK
ncbi:DUF262 domain-containing protein [Aureispira anguillae]|uniref:DUF262 domain-containing protein n=1 Tax=Aureispira anguillae TaxID=2864201 RepID=A0A915Y9Q4_9BACT|nr:DUF262 domain-containing protein [Aureispira anguillae]BDS09698.1 DUF262 domain-containing protein [Aureispira anguillae]